MYLEICSLGKNVKVQCHSNKQAFIFSMFKLFYCCSITVVSIFSPPLYPTPAKLTSLPCFHPPPLFCPCVLYSSSWKPFSPLSLPSSPLAIVRLFLTSMSLVIFCKQTGFFFLLSLLSPYYMCIYNPSEKASLALFI